MDGELIISGNDTRVRLAFGDGDVMVFPKGVLIAIADTSDMVTFKLTASRKTVCSWPFGRISPSLATAAETVEALNEIL